jgi:hypothetical protein
MAPKLQGPSGPGTGPTEDFASTSSFIESELHKKLKSLGDELGADMLTIIAPMRQPVDDFVRDAIEDIPTRSDKLFVLLETVGGSIEVVERIADVLRYHYPGEIGFLVPNFAMSAGTVLVMCGDRILMDYYAVLGPIDPQVRSRTKPDLFVPALGYLEKYNELIDKSRSGSLTGAEIAFLIEKFDPAELHQFEMAKKLSIDLLKKWLVQYKFKSWTQTRTTKQPVTKQMKEDRAAEIADKLNDTGSWKVHSRGLSMQVIENDLNLIIEDFGKSPELNRRVRSYYRLLQDYMITSKHTWVIHTQRRYLGIGV